MSSEKVRDVSLQDIQLVQNLIERCLQLYMSQKEVVTTLLHQAKIEPSFTELVWQKLEAENQDFFRAYNMRLIVKDQICRFNQLLEKQVELMDQMRKSKVVPVPSPNGSIVHPRLSMNENNMLPKIAAPPNVHAVGMTLQPCVHGVRFDSAANVLLAPGLNTGVRQGINGAMIKDEDSYPGTSTVFGINNGLVEHQNVIGEMSISPFNGGDSNTQAVADSFLDLETNSFGFLGQIPRNFSLSDLTADFSNSADILGSYCRSPFLVPDTNFLDSHHIQGEQDLKKLETISEGFGCEDFGTN